MGRITHLCLTECDGVVLNIPQDFRALTHLALPFFGTPDLLQLACSMPNLKCIVLLLDLGLPPGSVLFAISEVFHLRTQDPRFWLLDVVSEEGITRIGERKAFKAVWDEEVSGGQTMWELAETRTKEIQTVTGH